MKSNTAVVATEPNAVSVVSPAEMIRQAVSAGSDLEKLEKLLELQERWEGNEAKKAYHRAMAAFKADPPEIEKDKQVGYSTSKGKVGYAHASLSNVTTKIGKALSRHGLSASWRTTQNGTISVTCKITHEQGHSEETTLTAPADDSGSKNVIQAIGSTISYLERYSLLALTGLATHDMDDDGKGAGQFISEAEASSLLDHLNAIEANVDKFLEYMKVEKMGEIAKADLPKARAAIENAKALRAKKAAKP